jgi:hypothetical protein
LPSSELTPLTLCDNATTISSEKRDEPEGGDGSRSSSTLRKRVGHDQARPSRSKCRVGPMEMRAAASAKCGVWRSGARISFSSAGSTPAPSARRALSDRAGEAASAVARHGPATRARQCASTVRQAPNASTKATRSANSTSGAFGIRRIFKSIPCRVSGDHAQVSVPDTSAWEPRKIGSGPHQGPNSKVRSNF